MQGAHMAPLGRWLIRDALQAAAEDLPELLWWPQVGWVVTWD